MLGERLLRIDAATQRDRVDAVRDKMAVFLQRLARHRHADDEIVDGARRATSTSNAASSMTNCVAPCCAAAGANGLVELLVDREHLPAGGVGLERGPRPIERQFEPAHRPRIAPPRIQRRIRLRDDGGALLIGREIAKGAAGGNVAGRPKRSAA